jgi:hypothetical protein
MRPQSAAPEAGTSGRGRIDGKHAQNTTTPASAHVSLPADPAELLKLQLGDSELSLELNFARTQARRRGISLRYVQAENGGLFCIEAPAGIMKERLIEMLRDGTIVAHQVQS